MRWPRRSGSSSGATPRLTRTGSSISTRRNFPPNSGTACGTFAGRRMPRSTPAAVSGRPGDGTFARSDFFATMVLADAYLAAGELEQACGTALVALAAGEQIRSGRCVNYLREFRDHLARAGDTAAVREFSEQAARIPAVADRLTTRQASAVA